jgi:hypothetical protein
MGEQRPHKGERMTKQLRLRLALPLAALAASATCAAALGAGVNVHPVKGATYSGTLERAGTITLKVAGNGRTAKVSLGRAPAFCQGGSGPFTQKSEPATISKSGSLTATIAYTGVGQHKPFAHVTVKGDFFTFAGSKPVFDGTVRSAFVSAGSKSCDGQESFEAIEL